jgi:hypothetical protein
MEDAPRMEVGKGTSSETTSQPGGIWDTIDRLEEIVDKLLPE